MKSRLVYYSKMSDQHGMSVLSNKSIIQSPAVGRLTSPKQGEEVEVIGVEGGDEDEEDEGMNSDVSDRANNATFPSAASQAATRGNSDGPGDRYVTSLQRWWG